MAKKSWSELTSQQRKLVIAGAALELVLTTAALRDLSKRPSSAVRGPKFGWRLAMGAQPFGPLAYYALGRKG